MSQLSVAVKEREQQPGGEKGSLPVDGGGRQGGGGQIGEGTFCWGKRWTVTALMWPFVVCNKYFSCVYVKRVKETMRLHKKCDSLFRW